MFGKTRVALICIKRFLAKNPSSSVLVVVPTQNLKDQWYGLLLTNELPYVKVEIVNTITLKNSDVVYDYDLLVLDELHVYASDQFSKVFDKVKYNGQECFIFARRSNGYFDLRKIDGTKINANANYKKISLLQTRKNYITERRSEMAIPLHT